MPYLKALKRVPRGGRHIEPGEVFLVQSPADARIFKLTGAAEDHVPPPEDEREPLRRRATSLGLEVDGRWGIARLHEEIERAEQAQAQREPQPEPEAEPQAQPEPEPEPATVAAVDTASVEAEPDRGRYARRDMRAEGT